MTLISQFYSVSVKISPFEFGGSKEVGCYSTRDAAERVATFIRRAFEQKVTEGIDIQIQAYNAELVKTPMGLRLKDTPNGAITLIHETISQTETDRILKLLPILLQSKIIEPKNFILNVDRPKNICEGNFHCVILDFEPFDKSRRLFVGYYQSIQTATLVSHYIMQAHFNQKVGFGFDMRIETYEGKFIEYESGKLYIKSEENNHEIHASCESNEFIRISKCINKAIDLYSRNY